MTEANIPVDLLNPGQVFACLGFLETSIILSGQSEAAFDWSERGHARFYLRSSGSNDPFVTVLHFLKNAEVKTLIPFFSSIEIKKLKTPVVVQNIDSPFPYGEPEKIDKLPAILNDTHGNTVIVDHWGDTTNRDPIKFWAGAGGYPGANLLNDALKIFQQCKHIPISDPFSFSAPQRSSFRFDWRRDYIPINIGFSPNKHSSITMVGYPLVELLAAIGLTNARPFTVSRLNYRYAIIGRDSFHDYYDAMFLRAGLGGEKLPFPMRTFQMRLGWPGKEDHARCILETYEEA